MRLLKQLIFLFLIYVAYRILKNTFFPPFKKGYKEGMEKPSSSLPDEMVKDPMCQVYLPKREALPEKIGNELHFFCSDECRKKYKEQVKG